MIRIIYALLIFFLLIPLLSCARVKELNTIEKSKQTEQQDLTKIYAKRAKLTLKNGEKVKLKDAFINRDIGIVWTTEKDYKFNELIDLRYCKNHIGTHVAVWSGIMSIVIPTIILYSDIGNSVGESEGMAYASIGQFILVYMLPTSIFTGYLLGSRIYVNWKPVDLQTGFLHGISIQRKLMHNTMYIGIAIPIW